MAKQRQDKHVTWRNAALMRAGVGLRRRVVDDVRCWSSMMAVVATTDMWQSEQQAALHA